MQGLLCEGSSQCTMPAMLAISSTRAPAYMSAMVAMAGRGSPLPLIFHMEMVVAKKLEKVMPIKALIMEPKSISMLASFRMSPRSFINDPPLTIPLYDTIEVPRMKAFPVRSESPSDYEQISRIHSLAFGHDWEAKLIENLRNAPGFDPELSLVADLDGKAVGHICFSTVSIETPVSSTEAVILAPLAVLEEYRKSGAGTALVTEGIKRCRERGFRIMLVYGGPYYERFGFMTAHEQGIFRPNPMPGEVVRMLELVPGALDGVRGVIKYPKAFKPLVNQWYPD